jgi:hypothetical protein
LLFCLDPLLLQGFHLLLLFGPFLFPLLFLLVPQGLQAQIGFTFALHLKTLLLGLRSRRISSSLPLTLTLCFQLTLPLLAPLFALLRRFGLTDHRVAALL